MNETVSGPKKPRPPRPCEREKRRKLVSAQVAFHQRCIEYYLENPLTSSMQLKQCSREKGCGELKPINQFSDNKRSRGLKKMSVCKVCHTANVRRARLRSRPKTNDKDKQ